MAFSEALLNIKDSFRFHASVYGSLVPRLAYLSLYYFIFIVFRSGDRHLRPLVWLRQFGLSDIRVKVTTREGLRLEMDLHTAFDPLHAICGQKDYFFYEAFIPQPGQIVIDAGANIGIYTTLAGKYVGPQGMVISLEPHPRNCELLRKNVKENGLLQVRVVEAALDEKPGEARLYIHDRAINHSLKRKTDRSVQVSVMTVDQIAKEMDLLRVDLLKIDTEGNVVQILLGASSVLRRFHPRITFEYEPEDVAQGLIGLLKDYGYDLKKAGAIGYATPKIGSSA